APPVTLSSPRLVATLWAQTGGTLRGKVIETQPARAREIDAEEPWVSEASTALPELIREINKTSNNIAARSLLLSLHAAPGRGTPLLGAQTRVNAWLRTQGLADGDIRIDVGSGQSRSERGKPRAMVQLLRNAWRGVASKVFVDSLPIAGVDGTLAHRMRSGLAAGQAHLKTGTLHDTRALAGYVRARSGKVYAVAAIVNHPLAARATPTLDAFIEWVARNG
ncbi:MAG TPA: D-alanyl-D-alanine carboxypeptidase, partial [Albitalea sp.]